MNKKKTKELIDAIVADNLEKHARYTETRAIAGLKALEYRFGEHVAIDDVANRECPCCCSALSLHTEKVEYFRVVVSRYHIACGACGFSQPKDKYESVAECVANLPTCEKPKDIK